MDFQSIHDIGSMLAKNACIVKNYITGWHDEVLCPYVVPAPQGIIPVVILDQY